MTTTAFVLTDHGFAPVRPSLVDRVLARLRAHSLDDRLAAGEAPEHDLELAIRAQQLTSPRSRHRLAAAWDELADRATRPQLPYDNRVPVARQSVLDAAEQIDELTSVLRSKRPVTPRGIAIAQALLTTAWSPVYRRATGGDDVIAAVRRALVEF